MKLIRTIAAMAALAPVALGQPARGAEKLTGEQIRQAYQGNTVSGRYMRGGFFTEFHDSDGRALGNNGYEPNTDACWIIKEDQICYYYGPPSDRTVHCFTIEQTGALQVQRNASNGEINAIVTVEPGNPRNHTDSGRPWVCDGLISQAPSMGAPMSRRRLAAR